MYAIKPSQSLFTWLTFYWLLTRGKCNFQYVCKIEDVIALMIYLKGLTFKSFSLKGVANPLWFPDNLPERLPPVQPNPFVYGQETPGCLLRILSLYGQTNQPIRWQPGKLWKRFLRGRRGRWLNQPGGRFCSRSCKVWPQVRFVSPNKKNFGGQLYCLFQKTERNKNHPNRKLKAILWQKRTLLLPWYFRNSGALKEYLSALCVLQVHSCTSILTWQNISTFIGKSENSQYSTPAGFQRFLFQSFGHFPLRKLCH